MGIHEYQEALKLGRKEYKSSVAKGRFPYLPVLDEIINNDMIQTEKYLGLMNIPLDHVVGTSTMGRTQAFADNFMPILDYGTEFSVKWSNLADAQVTEGIRDPIEVYEYMNRYYVVEGNKRVSVLKYYEAFAISAFVTRKIPKLTDDEDVRHYYEFMKFSDISGLNTVEFTKEGSAERLLSLVGVQGKWDDITREKFNKVLFHFERAYRFNGGDKLPITMGDAILCFINIFGFEAALNMSDKEYNDNVVKSWNEFIMLTEKHSVDLVLDPKQEKAPEKRKLWSYFLPSTTKKVKVAFLYPKSPETSDWIYAHELGRTYLEETFPDEVSTICVNDVNEQNIAQVLESVIAQGATIVFGVAPQMMKQSLKAAIEHPEVKILNCSLNTPHRYIRTYYARMYEAKFISGLIAGAMAENDKIGYIADYPIYGMTANINAFALGAACVNPRAKIYLEWSTRKGYDLDTFIKENDIHYISNQDMITPQSASRQFGIYRIENGVTTNLAMPLWNWGIFYEKMIRSIMEGNYQNEENGERKALNYWWGMSAGVIDLICSNNVPTGVRRLVGHFKNDICSGSIVPFYGEIHSQDGTLKNGEEQEMKPEKIMKMDWLVENVIGRIPAIGELVDDAHSVVALKGVEETK